MTHIGQEFAFGLGCLFRLSSGDLQLLDQLGQAGCLLRLRLARRFEFAGIAPQLLLGPLACGDVAPLA